MPSVTASVRVNASPEVIWELFCDPSRYPEWVVPTDRMLEVPDGPLEQGSIYKEYGGIPPFKDESEWKVTEFEPHRRQVHVGDDGNATLDLEVLIEPEKGGSRLTQTLDLKPRGVPAALNVVLWPLLMRRRAQAAMDGTVENAKRVLEDRGAG